jgi:hypothetical protein
MFSVCKSAPWKPSALPLQTRFPTSGELTPVAGQNRPQLQLRYQTHGGLTHRRSCECAFLHRKNRFFRRQTFALQQERGASAPRGMFSVCKSAPWKPSALRLQTRFPTSGGLTPVAGRKRPQLQLRYQTHGGLTPAALGNVRSCIEKIVFSPANVRTAPRAGGVSPPWDVLGMRTRNVEIRRMAVATVVSDRQAADAGRWKKASAIAIALPNPRRDDAPSL